MGSTLHYAQHLAINLENQAILLPHPKRPWRVFLSPSPRWRVFRFREGDFVRGGRFCAPSQATPGTTPTVPPSRDNNALPRHFRPPKTNTPSRASRYTGYTLPQAPPEGGSCTGRVILSGEGDSVHPHKPLQARRRQFHPPATITPSRDISALQGTSTFQSELLDSQFQILRGVEETRVRGARKTAIRKHLSELNPDLMNRLGATTAAYLATSCG